MPQPTVNRFFKGLNSDMSLTDRSQDMFLDGHNIRLARREEGTLWATNIRGNEETFSLSDGFIPIGSKEFDGYLFILSVNGATGISEIGSYPAPAITGGINRAYRPLQNYTTSNYVSQIGDDCLLPDVTDLGNFTTPHLNFQCDKPARVEIRLDYDGSVNIYWTDDFNPWRVVNSGFVLSTGIANRRYITQDMVISGFINGINESDKHPIVNMINTMQGGSLRVGNYFFFVRYTDLNFLSTSFIGQSGPVPVFNTTGLSSSTTFGGEPQGVTDKAVDLLISNLDTSIGFIEIGFLRAYGNELFEAFIIDKRYSINGNTFRQVRITGNEPLIPISVGDLLAYKPSDAIYCKDMAQELKQLFIANTRGIALDHPDLRRFMCSLTLDERTVNNGPADAIKNDSTDNPYSKDSNDTEERVGYFSGETYIFACVPVFKGGFMGMPYPMTGVDNYNSLAANVNKSGIYRFKRSHEEKFWDGTNTFIKNISVNNTAAQSIYTTSQWLQDNLIGVYIARGERNKILLYQGLSLRTYNGNMNPYQGTSKTTPNVSLNTYEINGNIVTSSGGAIQNGADDWFAKDSIPLFEPATYHLMARIDTLPPLGINFRSRYFGYSHPYDYTKRNDFTDLQRLSVFSVDYYIDKISVPDTAYVQMVGTTNYYNDWERESTSNNTIPINNTNAIAGWRTTPTDTGPSEVFDVTSKISIPLFNRGNVQTFVGYNQLNITYTRDGFSSEAFDIVGWSAIPFNGFTGRYDEGRKAIENGLYYYEETAVIAGAKQWSISLPVSTPDYIGLLTAPSYVPTFNAVTGDFDHYVDKWDRAIVNVCTTNPDSIDYLDLYDFKNTNFFAIGNFQPIADFMSIPQHNYYRGDCIIARSYLKIFNGSVENISTSFFDILSGVDGAGLLIYGGNNFDEAIEDFKRGYGYWISIVTEQMYNSNYRHELGRNKFYPKTNVLNPGKDFSWIYDSPESYFYNKGYREYLGARSWVGIDLLQPISNNMFPTRIRPSLPHIFGAVRDGYRQFIPADAKDFDYAAGAIQAICTMYGSLYSFQNRAINLHPLQERVTQQVTEGSTAILGSSQGLTDFRQVIKEGYGTQHRFSVIKAGSALYCIDFNKRSILRITGSSVENLDIVKGVQTWFRKIVSIYSTGFSDIMEQLPNAFPCGLGIFGAYNRKYKDIVWTLRLGNEDKTIVFSEEVDAFLGTHGYKPIGYGMVEEDFYCFDGSKAYLQDVSDKYQTFFGVLDNWKLRWATNEGAEMTKHWDNIIISSNNRIFKLIKYETQHQTAEQNPFIPLVQFWYAPTYRENEWRLPVRRADNVKEPELSIYDDFSIDKTPLRGRYLITEIHYQADKELWVREVITFHNNSFV